MKHIFCRKYIFCIRSSTYVAHTYFPGQFTYRDSNKQEGNPFWDPKTANSDSTAKIIGEKHTEYKNYIRVFLGLENGAFLQDVVIKYYGRSPVPDSISCREGLMKNERTYFVGGEKL